MFKKRNRIYTSPNLKVSEGKKYKYLLKNLGFLTIGNFATGVLSIILIPLYTDILTRAEYGTYELINTTIGFLLPILTLCIGDAMSTFALLKKYDFTELLSISVRIILFGNVMVALLLIINNIFCFSRIVHEYSIFFMFMYFFQSFQILLTSYARGIEKISKLSISGVIATVTTLSFNIIFLAIIRLGLKGYFLANIIGPLIQCLYLLFSTKAYKDIKILKKNHMLKKSMIEFSLPLIPTNVAWWINSVADRYVITYFCGIDINGSYSVASKIPSILNLVQSIFSQAWSISAIKEIESRDRTVFFTRIYNTLNCILVILCSILIGSDKLISRLLFANDFYSAWIYAPWLTIAVIFLALSSFFGGVFVAEKDTRIYAKSTLIGATINIIFNLFLVPFLGAIGAAYATMISYFTVWLLRCFKALSYVKIKIKFLRDFIAYIILVFQSLILFYADDLLLYLIETVLLLMLLFIYRKELLSFAKGV